MQRVHLGIGLNGSTVHVVSSLGQRTSITAEAARSPEDWVELATYGVPLPDPHVLLACVALPPSHPRVYREQVVEAARQAGWDGLLLVHALAAVQRGLRGRSPSEAGEHVAVVAVAPELSAVGVLDGHRPTPLDQDTVRPIAGREAREVAVSLRCMLKRRPREQVRRLLKRVFITGDAEEVQRVGLRVYERELEALGVEQIEFNLEPFLVAEGAEMIAEETEPSAWRRVRRRRV